MDCKTRSVRYDLQPFYYEGKRSLICNEKVKVTVFAGLRGTAAKSCDALFGTAVLEVKIGQAYNMTVQEYCKFPLHF